MSAALFSLHTFHYYRFAAEDADKELQFAGGRL